MISEDKNKVFYYFVNLPDRFMSSKHDLVSISSGYFPSVGQYKCAVSYIKCDFNIHAEFHHKDRNLTSELTIRPFESEFKRYPFNEFTDAEFWSLVNYLQDGCACNDNLFEIKEDRAAYFAKVIDY
ncbi:hypothetical protein N9H09_02045 [bacterium]|nr:hypothetical protein [bacterium]